MRLLVTRPDPDALALKARLDTMGHATHVFPLLSASFDNVEPVDLSEAQALVVTSRWGLIGLKAQGAHRIAAQIPVFAVGAATERLARSMGFADVTVGGGDVASLVPEILAVCDPHAGVLLHLAGNETAGNLVGELELHGFRVVQQVVYRMQPATAFDPATARAIATGELDGVLLFSPRSAAVYVDLVRKAGLVTEARRLAHFCLSPNVAARLAPLAQTAIEIADRPSLDALLDLLDA